jgi:hypothetical protein
MPPQSPPARERRPTPAQAESARRVARNLARSRLGDRRMSADLSGVPDPIRLLLLDMLDAARAHVHAQRDQDGTA